MQQQQQLDSAISFPFLSHSCLPHPFYSNEARTDADVWPHEGLSHLGHDRSDLDVALPKGLGDEELLGPQGGPWEDHDSAVMGFR